MATLKVEKHEIKEVPLEELKNVLQKGLEANFKHVQVEVVDCPDLREKPFCLKQQGLCGSPRVADVGGVPYLIPTPQLDKTYNIDTVAESCELPGAYVIGPGAGPCHHLGTNSEMIANVRSKSTNADIGTYLYTVNPGDEKIREHKLSDSKDFSLMANLLLSEGKPGKVLRVKARERTGKENFTDTMRLALKDRYKDQIVTLAGPFCILKGSAKLHVMPAFSKTPLKSDAEVDSWLRFYDVPAILTCISVFHSTDPGLDLRIEHTHCFGPEHGQGGHYHYDTTPDSVDYLGYFVPAQILYRVDRP